MKNKKLLIGAFIASAVLFTSCKKAVTQENLNPQNPQVPVVNPENIVENLEIKISEDLVISEAPQGLTANAKVILPSEIVGGNEAVSEIKEISLIGSKVDTQVEVTLKIKDSNPKSIISNSEVASTKTYVISEFKDGKWNEIGNYYRGGEKELKARIKLAKTTEQKIVIAVREKIDSIKIVSENIYGAYNSASILITEAMRVGLGIDAMIYPSSNLAKARVEKNFSWNSTEDFASLYQYLANKVTVGTISGRNLKNFLVKRSSSFANLDVQAGILEYNVKLDKTGKLLDKESMFFLNGKKIVDDKIYTVGFDSYKTNSYNLDAFGFVKTLDSTKTQGELLQDYMKNTNVLPNTTKYNSKVEKEPGLTQENKNIYEIQGTGFVSPLEGDIVKGVKGIITAVDANGTNAANGINGFYLQAETADGDDRTSDGIYVKYSLTKTTANTAKLNDIKVGNKISLDALVEEYVSESEGLSQTQLNKISNVIVSETNKELPKPALLGKDRKIPTTVISSYRGDLNKKTTLDLNEGIDFYESIEGMRVSLDSPLVTDVYGGKQIYVVAPDNYTKELFNSMGGLVIKEGDMNPEIMVINQETIIGSNTDTNTFAHPKDISKGAKFMGVVEGVIKYNTGSNGGYTFINTKPLPSYSVSSSTKETVTFTGDSKNLTIGSYNVENLYATAGHMDKIAESIVNNLKNPDILGLIEIQDDDGENGGQATGASAKLTLDTLVSKVNTLSKLNYKWINIDPEENKDGGAPGGNIRVAYIYNSDRVTFKQKGDVDFKTVGSVLSDGTLNLNPVRINPLNKYFENSRKSLAAQFEFNGQRVTVIANHLNSKRGDSSMWGAVQPVTLGSVAQRIEMAKEINKFAKAIVDKGENVVLLGDFNEFYFEKAMEEFKGNVKNLMEKLPLNERYTYVYKGNSQTLDHMLISPKMYDKAEIDIVHINAGFLDQISDHDPVVSKFYMP